MVDVTPLIKQNAQIIQSYAGGQFRVSGKLYKTSIIVTPEMTYEWINKGFEGLTVSDFSILLPPHPISPDGRDHPLPVGEREAKGGSLEQGEGGVDVVLLGTGASIKFLKPFLKNQLKDAGLHIECMDTGAACRTYNVLMAEGRRVAAALSLS